MMTTTMMTTAAAPVGYDDGETKGMLMTRCCSLLIKLNYERIYMLFMFFIMMVMVLLCCAAPFASATWLLMLDLHNIPRTRAIMSAS